MNRPGLSFSRPSLVLPIGLAMATPAVSDRWFLLCLLSASFTVRSGARLVLGPTARCPPGFNCKRSHRWISHDDRNILPNTMPSPSPGFG
ncbi:hypothetical protein BO94DRAFT_536284 [Aspergillus sclerotioniger CBS 115572]|uniref:Uncharacterized protein n=1 Tax=Aspergillus sclerotioniger CBS 115572 TaxID=1450535 RepID=A0A317WHH7_9EURO|nr:hypothetical protein BO94DRAFT_536284 [Aspergillus sclerotioniger CBS 115572]PWY84687.1 hypothetical protein BO94DRAFT_536284 [Aspergillus sclerotioniger CBS 115572]